MTTYRTGDYVFPTDLPRRFLCRVMQAETLAVGRESCQILKLEPLEGPWPAGTSLIRLDPVVVRAGARELWSRRGTRWSADGARPRPPARAA
jgi:hypothetical protein